MATKIIYLCTILLVCQISSGKDQINDELIDSIFNDRASYVANIPEKYRYHYNFIINIGNRSIIDALKKAIPDKSLSDGNLYMCEDISTDELGEKRGKIWNNDFVISYRWDALNKRVEIENHKSHGRDTTFVKDIEDWNENVTNRSYYYWAGGSGGSFILCSKITSNIGLVKMWHSAFKSYSKDEPLHCIREQPEDGYQIRQQVNCDWIIDKKREEVVIFLIEIEKENGNKVFDCDGKEMVFKQL